MTRRLVRSYLAIAGFVLLVLEIPLAVNLAAREYDALEADVIGDAVVLAAVVEEDLEREQPVVLPHSVAEYTAVSGSRVVVVDDRGVSLADTGAEVPRDFSTRPEIEQALAGARATGRRRSETLGQELVYVAVPVASEGVVHGAVRLTYPTAVVRGRILRLWLALAGVAVVVLVATALVATRLARWAVRPIAAIETAVTRFGEGDLAARADVADGPSEVVALAAHIDDMADRIEELVAVQRGFVADASHQLRTPLTGLRLELENLEAGAADEATRAGLERAVDATTRLARLVDGLLALARLEGQRPELEPLDVPWVVDTVAGTWRALADEAGVTLRTVVAEDVAGTSARGVPDHVAQVLNVFLDNAMAVSEQGATITVAARIVDGRVRLEVADEGPGMPAAERERAFDRSWQGTVRTGTTGLGLAIARRLADAMRADVGLDDAPVGVVAWVLLAR